MAEVISFTKKAPDQSGAFHFLEGEITLLKLS